MAWNIVVGGLTLRIYPNADEISVEPSIVSNIAVGRTFATDTWVYTPSERRTLRGRILLPVAASTTDTGFVAFQAASTTLPAQPNATDWTVPAGALTDGGSPATFLVEANNFNYGQQSVSYILNLTNPNATVASNQVITGVEVKLKIRPDASFTVPLVVSLIRNNQVIGQNKADAFNQNWFPFKSRIYQYFYYGGPGDTWGLPLVYSDIGSTFGLAFQAYGSFTSSGTVGLSFDDAYMRIYSSTFGVSTEVINNLKAAVMQSTQVTLSDDEGNGTAYYIESFQHSRQQTIGSDKFVNFQLGLVKDG